MYISIPRFQFRFVFSQMIQQTGPQIFQRFSVIPGVKVHVRCHQVMQRLFIVSGSILKLTVVLFTYYFQYVSHDVGGNGFLRKTFHNLFTFTFDYSHQFPAINQRIVPF